MVVGSHLDWIHHEDSLRMERREIPRGLQVTAECAISKGQSNDIMRQYRNEIQSPVPEDTDGTWRIKFLVCILPMALDAADGMCMDTHR